MGKVKEERWMDQAKCRLEKIPPSFFFPERGDFLALREAKIICATCKVRDECLDYSYREHIKIGVFGGLSAKERRLRKREWRRIHLAKD